MASGFVVSDYVSVLRDLLDSEELKISSSYSSSLKATIEKIVNERSEVFERCFLEVKEAVEKVRTCGKEQPYFRGMFLYLAQELPKILQKLPKDYNDPIVWQVRGCS